MLINDYSQNRLNIIFQQTLIRATFLTALPVRRRGREWVPLWE